MWTSEKKLQLIKGTNVNYSSKDGFQSAVFGPIFWSAIHMVSFNYPVHPSREDKYNYVNWLLSVGNVLPCKYCRDNFVTNLNSAGWNPHDDLSVAIDMNQAILKSRDSFSRFCYTLHDEVNKMLNKTSPPFQEVRYKFELLRAKCMTEKEKLELKKSQQELGCIRPAENGIRAKCVINIVPKDTNTPGFQIDKRCMLTDEQHS